MSKEHSLPSVRLPLVTLTPLFLGGADPRGDPELRASSIRGALRFWLRALLGGCYGTDDQALAEIRRLEAETFGEAGGEGKAGASTIVVRTTRVRMQKQAFEENLQSLTYLLFGMQKVGSLNARQYFIPGSQFNLMLEGRSGTSVEQQEKALRRALLATWLLIHLGGVGARSRRAAGSVGVRLHSVKMPEGGRRYQPVLLQGLPFHLRSQLDDAAQRFGDTLSRIRQELGAQSRPLQSLPQWEILHPQACSIWLFSFDKLTSTSQKADKGREQHFVADSDWQLAMNQLQQLLRNIRGEFKEIDDRAVFGAPLRGSQVQKMRRPSPLLLSVTLAANGQLMGVVTLFRAQLYKDPGLVDSSLLDKLTKAVDRQLRSSFSNVAEVQYA